MPSGIQVYNSSGALVIDTSTSIGSILGGFYMGGSYAASGTITNSYFTQGTPFFFLVTMDFPSGVSTTQKPDVIFSGNILSYSWSGPSIDSGVVAYIIYGVY